MPAVRSWLLHGLLPAAGGHAAAMAVALAPVMAPGRLVPLVALALPALAVVLRRRVRVRDLALAASSFAVAASQGAGLALVPTLLSWCGTPSGHAWPSAGALGTALAGAAAHLLSMSGLVAALACGAARVVARLQAVVRAAASRCAKRSAR